MKKPLVSRIPMAFTLPGYVQTFFIQLHILLCKTTFKGKEVVKINNRKRCQSCGSPGKQNQHKETIIINNQVISNTFPNGSLNLLLGFPYILTTEDLAPPPSIIPQMPSFAVDPGAISGCLYRYTYIWPRNGRPYWFYPTFVGRRSVAGYRWTGFFWVYAGVDVNQIREFQCV